jgi:hypothetical protein
VAASSVVAAREEVDSRYLEAVVVVAMMAVVVDTGYLIVAVVVARVESPADTEVWVAILPLLVVLACLAIVVADTESSVVVAAAAAARADYSVVVAQGSPFVTRLSTDSSLWGK